MDSNDLNSENLANLLSPSYISSLGHEQKIRTEDEYAARNNFMQMIKTSLNALGLTQYRDKSGSKSNNMESSIVDPTFLQTWIQLKNEFIAEILSPYKIATTEIRNRNLINASPEGNQLIKQLDEYAQIIEEDINNKFNCEWSEWIPELKKAIGSAFLTGSAICKVFFDPILNRPTVRMIPPENILVNPNEPSLEAARWIGHVYMLSEEELNIYQSKGIFRDVTVYPDNGTDSGMDTQSVREVEQRISSIDDITKTSDQVKYYTFVEIQFWECAANNQDPAILSDDPSKNFIYYPYTLHIHKETGTVMALDEMWDIVDGEVKKRQSMFNFTFLDGIDFWGMGLAQTCIGLHNTATTIFRDLTSSLGLANSQTIIMSKDLALQQSTINLKYGAVNQLPISSASAREALVPLQFAQPNPMYNDFLNQTREQINRVAGLSTVTLENLPANVQGNFLLALMDKETKPMSVVMQNFQFGLNQMFRILHKILREDWKDKFIIPDFPFTYGEVYSPLIQIVSAVDPTMANSASQLIRMQAVFENAMQNPQIHNMHAIYERLYKIMKIDAINELLLPEEVIQQQQQQQMEAEQQAQAQAQQQAQAQNQLLQQDLQNKHEINNKELMLKAEKAQSEADLAKQKLISEEMREKIKADFELLKEKGEVTKQKNIEIAAIYEAQLKFLIEKSKLELQGASPIPEIEPPQLEEYDISLIDENNLVGTPEEIS